jgi:hypothetical protein
MSIKKFVLVMVILVALTGCQLVNATPAGPSAQDLAATMVAATAAAIPPATNTPVPAPTETPIPPSPTIAPTSAPSLTPTPAGPVIITDDFSSDKGRFKCDKCEIKDGALYMGPYPSTDSYNAYMAFCADCPVVTDYKMSVDATFAEGASDRGFGLLLRENDGNFFDLEIATWQVYAVWHFDSKKGVNDAWKPYTGNGWVQGGLKAGRQTNHIEVTMKSTESGSTLYIVMNNRSKRTVELPSGKGRVGLLVGMHSLGVTFDNFYFEEIRP